MKNLVHAITLLTTLLVFTLTTSAQLPASSAQRITDILSFDDHRIELTRMSAGITILLADQRLTDQPTRAMLLDSKVALTEMLDGKLGTKSRTLTNLTKWMREQGDAKIALSQAGGERTEQEQFILDNLLAGQETHLVSIIRGILGIYVEVDRENAGADNLNALLQLYFNHRKILERSSWLASSFLWNTPQWIQTRFVQLTVEQRRQFLEDVNTERSIDALGPRADEEPGPPPTVQEQAAYDTAYQFIVANTPQP